MSIYSAIILALSICYAADRVVYAIVCASGKKA